MSIINDFYLLSQRPNHEIKKKGEIGDTPDGEKGVHPWRMYQESRRRASGKKVGVEKGGVV
jgi:hypothetical protein